MGCPCGMDALDGTVKVSNGLLALPAAVGTGVETAIVSNNPKISFAASLPAVCFRGACVVDGAGSPKKSTTPCCDWVGCAGTLPGVLLSRTIA